VEWAAWASKARAVPAAGRLKAASGRPFFFDAKSWPQAGRTRPLKVAGEERTSLRIAFFLAEDLCVT